MLGHLGSIYSHIDSDLITSVAESQGYDVVACADMLAALSVTKSPVLAAKEACAAELQPADISRAALSNDTQQSGSECKDTVTSLTPEPDPDYFGWEDELGAWEEDEDGLSVLQSLFPRLSAQQLISGHSLFPVLAVWNLSRV